MGDELTIYAKKEDLVRLDSAVKNLSDKVESAFPKDDEGAVDYAGHRLYHKAKSRTEDSLSKAKTSFMTNILTWATIGIITILGNFIVDVYVKPIFLTASKVVK